MFFYLMSSLQFPASMVSLPVVLYCPGNENTYVRKFLYLDARMIPAAPKQRRKPVNITHCPLSISEY
jgi:hypothetical protein